MHIAVMTLNRGRGSGNVARDQVTALLAAGHEVTYMCTLLTEPVMGANNRDVVLQESAVPVHEFLPMSERPQRRVSAMSHAEARRYTAAFIAALAGIEKLDLIIAHHASITATAARVVAQARGIPYVVFVHGTGIEPRHHGGYNDQVWAEIAHALAEAAGIMVTTEYVRDRLVRPLVAVPDDRFLIIPCGVDPEAFLPVPGTDIKARYGLPARYVIVPGALTYAKGPQNVVAASRFYSNLAPTVFIGDGDLAEELAADLGDRGRILGFVPTVDKNALIAGATILAAGPVKREHFGIIYIEAMAAGTVPVAYSGGGVDTIVTPDVGVLTDRSPRALGTAIRRLLMDDWQRQQYARAGPAVAAARYDGRELGRRLAAWIEAVRSDTLHRAAKSA